MPQSLKIVRGVCPHDCPDTCSFLTTVDESGRAVKIRGNPDHSLTAGFLCAKVNHYLERVYHPDRLTHPLRRTGKKGSGEFERISWDEAIRAIADNLRRVKNEHGGEAILPYSYAGTMGKIQGESLAARFFHTLGASKLDRTICASAGKAGSEITLGNRRAGVDPEAAVNCKLIINWGSNTAVTNVHLWRIQHEARKRGAEIITIDPYRTPTAAKSDWWIPIRPGTDAALALAIMHVLIRDAMIDQDYLERYCMGFQELKERVLNEPYAPPDVSHITGLRVDQIEHLARMYGTSRPALIRLNYGLQRHGGGGMAVRAITCLPAFTGDWRYPGAGAMLSTSGHFPSAAGLEHAHLCPPNTRTINMTRLAEALHNEEPGPPVKAVVVYNSNPVSIAPHQGKVIRGFEREDLFTVVLEQFLTDTARYADIVLPATTQLEHWDVHTAYGHFDLQVNEPAIAPLAEAKPNTEAFRLLAAAMGMEPELFAATDRELIEEYLRGPIPDGPVRVVPENFAPYAEGNFGTPSGKCHLSSPLEAAAGRDPLPYYQPPHEDPQTKPELAKRFPIQLLTPPSPTFLNSTFVNVDHLRNQAVTPTLEIHRHDARTRNIISGDRVRIFNDRGAFQATAVLSDNVKPGVAVSTGCWWAKYTADGANVNATTSTALTDFGGGATFFDNLVEIAKVGV